MTSNPPDSAGVFIALEGGEGVGKSTQERMLAEYLVAKGHEVVRTREPGGTPVAEEIRRILLTPRADGLDAHAEALLFAAARAEHVARVIRPALDRGSVVICDRFLDSSVAYQGLGRELGADVIRDLSLWATGGLVPDLVIVLDLDPVIGLGRLVSADRLEREPLEYHQRVRAGFTALAADHPDRYDLIDAANTPTGVAAAIRERVDDLLARRGRLGSSS